MNLIFYFNDLDDLDEFINSVFQNTLPKNRTGKTEAFGNYSPIFLRTTH